MTIALMILFAEAVVNGITFYFSKRKKCKAPQLRNILYYKSNTQLMVRALHFS